MTLPAWRDWVFALKVCAAALLALFVALWIDLPRPYWAVSTVFITIQPLAGATRSNAIYRVYGTLPGSIEYIRVGKLRALAVTTAMPRCG